MAGWELLSLGERPFILPCDRDLPASEQVIWHIRPLTSVEKVRLKNYSTYVSASGETRQAMGTFVVETIKAGLLRVENLRFRDGTALIVPTRQDETAWTTFLNPIPDYILSDLFVEIARISELTKAQEGNSASPSNVPSNSTAVPATAPDASAE